MLSFSSTQLLTKRSYATALLAYAVSFLIPNTGNTLSPTKELLHPLFWTTLCTKPVRLHNRIDICSPNMRHLPTTCLHAKPTTATTHDKQQPGQDSTEASTPEMRKVVAVWAYATEKVGTVRSIVTVHDTYTRPTSRFHGLFRRPKHRSKSSQTPTKNYPTNISCTHHT